MSERTKQLDVLLRQEIAEIVNREVGDPRIGFVTITDVETSPDLRHARVFVTVLGDDVRRKKALEGLRSAASFVRRSLSKRLHHMRRIPELTFDYDDALERETRIEKLLDQIKTEEQ